MMNTEWMIEAICPQKEGITKEETAKICAECLYKIWDFPVSEAGLNSAMCSITLGKLASDLDSIVSKIAGIKEFTEQQLSPTQRINTRPCCQVRSTLPSCSRGFGTLVHNTTFQMETT